MLESLSVNKPNKATQLVSLFMVAHCLGEVYAKWPVRGACEGDI